MLISDRGACDRVAHRPLHLLISAAVLSCPDRKLAVGLQKRREPRGDQET